MKYEDKAKLTQIIPKIKKYARLLNHAPLHISQRPRLPIQPKSIHSQSQVNPKSTPSQHKLELKQICNQISK